MLGGQTLSCDSSFNTSSMQHIKISQQYKMLGIPQRAQWKLSGAQSPFKDTALQHAIDLSPMNMCWVVEAGCVYERAPDCDRSLRQGGRNLSPRDP